MEDNCTNNAEEIITKEWNALNIEDQRDALPPNPEYQLALNNTNIWKNRYGNVLPNPETRVKLGSLDDFSSEQDLDENSTYINANWITTTLGTSYIATQAPLAHTFADFWQMVFENKVCLIVMLTKFVEGGRNKAEPYWEEKGRTSLFKNILCVTLTYEEQYDEEITIRKFTLKHVTGAVHEVIHIHYVGWPDFGRPETTSHFKNVLSLVERYHNAAGRNTPILSHCSAGLGRTGTFIAAHICLESIKKNSSEKIDLKELVKGLRKQRRGMVQSIEQFQFLHLIVNEMIEEKAKSELEGVFKSPTTVFRRNLSQSMPGVQAKIVKKKVGLRRSCSGAEEKRRQKMISALKQERLVKFAGNCPSL